MRPSKPDVHLGSKAFTRECGLALGVIACAAVAGIFALVEVIYHGSDRAVHAVFIAFGLCFLLIAVRSNRRQAYVNITGLAPAMLAQDPIPALVTSTNGQIVFANDVAKTRFDVSEVNLVQDALAFHFANVDKEFADLSEEALRMGFSEATAPLSDGSLSVRVLRISDAYLQWRFETPPTNKEAGALLDLPQVRTDRDGRIKYLNQPARSLLRGQPVHVSDFTEEGLRTGLQELKIGNSRKCVVGIERKASDGGTDYFLAPIEHRTCQEGSRATPIDNLPVAILKVGPGGRIEVANQFGKDLLGLENSENFIQDYLEGLGRPVKDWVDEVINSEGGSSSEVLRVMQKDEELYLQVSLRRSMFSEDRSATAILHDATEMKRLEAQFNQSQKMQAIGELAGGVAHDFNNLLTAISGHCDLLLLRRDEGHPDYGDLMQIYQNANRAAALVEQLLAFSRKQTLRPKKVDLRNTLQDLGHLLDRLVGAPIRLSVHHDTTPTSIWVDKRQFEQVIVNLVVNARDAMPGGGEIQISTSVRKLVRDLKRDRANVPAGDYVVISVQDQGQGIPEAQKQKIFDPFFTTKPQGKGTGLGLSMAYGIVKQSGGFIFVESEVGQGTRFDLYFPIRRGNDVAPRATVPERIGDSTSDGVDIGLLESMNRVAETRRSGEKTIPAAGFDTVEAVPAPGIGVVLLVEDEASVRAFASRALTMRGYTVLEADSAEQALDVLAVTATPIDLFITDVVMPGDDGPTWVRKAREDYPETRVVFMSGYTEEAFAENRGPLSNSVFLQKPFSLSDLTKTVKEQVEIARAS